MYFAQYCRLGVHVGVSNRTVIRAASKLLKHPHDRDATARKTRHRWYRNILREHRDARALYAVVTGSI